MVSFVTSRTEEMVMSSTAFAHSQAAGELSRPEPHLLRAGRRWHWAPPEGIEPAGLLDGDIIAGSSGTRVYVQGLDGIYRLDGGYPRTEEDPLSWRESTLAVLAGLPGWGSSVSSAPINDSIEYVAGRTDVGPADYRLQIDFSDERAESQFRAATRAAGHAAGETGRHARSLRFTDDSNPREGRYKAFVTPLRASKAHAVQRITTRLLPAPGRQPVDILFVGDSLPDLFMGLYGAVGYHATLLLAGGSRLAPLITDPDATEFAGIDMRAIKRRLRHTGEVGTFAYQTPCGPERTVVVGDLAFPGTVSAETVARYLDQATR